MSRYAYFAAAVMALVLLSVSHWKAYVSGKEAIRAEWRTEKLAMELQAENNRLLSQASINKIDRTGAAKAKQQAVQDQAILKKVETNVPITLPLLPGSFRVQHDSAATGQEIDDPSTFDVAPVAPRTVAKTVSRNYADARFDKERLADLQAIVRASGCFDVGKNDFEEEKYRE